MKKILLFLTLVLCAFCTTVAYASPKSVAIYVEGDVSQAQESIINSAISARMIQYRGYAIYERNEAFIDAVNREHDYQVSGEVPLSQIRVMGNKFGVDYVLAVVVTIDEGRTYMTAKMIKIVTGRVIKQVSMDRKGYETKTLQNLANNVVYRILN